LRILISSDWQAAYKNIEKCKLIFEQEKKLATSCDLVLDLGDQKDEYCPVDLRPLKLLVQRAEYHKEKLLAVMGNHDRVGQYNDASNWFSILRPTGCTAIDKPVIKHLGSSVILGILPYMHDIEELRAAATKLGKQMKHYGKSVNMRRILLFHTTVHGAILNASGTPAESSISTADLCTADYDYCFGGHIHKRQYLNKHTMYVGSPFAHDWGETNDEKGFTIYNSFTNAVTFEPSCIPGYYTWDFLKTDKPEIVDGSKIKVRVHVALGKNYYRKIEEKKAIVEKAYPNADVFAVPVFAVEEEREVVIEADSSDDEKINSYVKASLPKELRKHKDAVVTYLNAKLLTIRHSTVKATGKLTFLSVEAENAMSFEHVKIRLKNRGLTVVQGKNEDVPGNSNGAGKTNLLNLPVVAIAGQTFKGQKHAEWARETTAAPALITLKVLDEDGKKIRIVRGQRPTKLKVFVNDKDESTGRRHIGKKETQGLLEETIGFTFQTLANSVYIDSKVSDAFLKGTQKDRVELISKFQNLERFEFAKKLVVLDLTSYKRQLIDVADEIGIEENYVKESNVTLHEYRQDHKYKESELLTQLQKKKDKVASLGKYAHEITQKEALLQLLQRQLVKIETMQTENENKTYSITERLQELKENVKHARDKMRMTICPSCKRPLDVEDRTEAINHLREEIEKWTDVHNGLCDKREELSKRKDRVFVKHDDCKTAIDLYNDARDRATENLKDAEIELTQYRENKPNKRAIDRLLTGVKKAKSKIATMQSTHEHYVQQLEIMKYCDTAFGRDGIPLFLNSLVAPQLNKAAKEYSTIFTDGEIQVIFKLEDGAFNPHVINTHGSSKIKGQSEGESAWAGLIASLALRELAPPTNLLVLDEPGNGLDPMNARTFGRKLKKLTQRFSSVFVVTHNQNILSELEGESTITVVKQNGVSRIEEQ
jgi:ABC-type transport system involved in cytochrome c biogenesis ATPase subunit